MKLWHISPMKCMICNHYACYEELPVCRRCLPRFQLLLTDTCPHCGKTAANCQCGNGPKFAFFYRGYESKRLMWFIKYNADDRAIAFLAELLIKANGINPKSYDAITYVPRLRQNVRRYGYDAAKEIAKAISELYGVPLITTLKRNGGKDQKLLSRGERLKSMQGRYSLVAAPPQKYKRLLLIDDIFTTGATLTHCADLLRKSVTESVTPLVMAKTILNKRGE